MDGGLVAHTLDEQRDINDSKAIFGDVASLKTEPEMVQLAKQLIDRQTTTYDPADLEDQYETRLRAMIEAKLKGEGIDVSEPEEPDRGNVIDLMAALKKSLGQASEQKPAGTAKKPAREVKPRAAAQPAAKAPRKRAS
jgi:DNA end-binding protein Ku